MKKDNRSRSRADKAASRKATTVTYKEYVESTSYESTVIRTFNDWTKHNSIRVHNVELTETPLPHKTFFGKTWVENRPTLTFESPKGVVYSLQFRGNMEELADACKYFPHEVCKFFEKAVPVE